MSIPQSGGGRIEKYNQLIEYLASGCKPKSDWRIGTEHEKFGYCKETLSPIPYNGDRSVLAILKGLEKVVINQNVNSLVVKPLKCLVPTKKGNLILQVLL